MSFAKFSILPRHLLHINFSTSQITSLPLRSGIQCWFPQKVLQMPRKKLSLVIIYASPNLKADQLNWLTKTIAANGFITALVNAGATSSVTKIINLVNNSRIKNHVNINKVGLLSYARSSVLSLSMVGAKLQPDELSKLDQQYRSAIQSLHKHKNPHIRGVLLLAPGYATAFQPKGMTAIDIPVFIIYGENDALTQSEHAVYYSKNLPEAGVVMIPGRKLHPLEWKPPAEIAHMPMLPEQISSDSRKILIRMSVEFFYRILQ